MSEFFQPLDPAAAPDPVTPRDSPADAAGWAQVTPAGQGPAPYDISAPQDIAGIGGIFDAANAVAGAGALYPKGARQSEAEALLESPAGAPAMNVTAGFPNYENTDPSPGADMENPIQGAGDYPGTTQGGIPVYGADEGSPVPGAPPAGSMDTPGGDYPGTTQAGVPKYGTS